MDVETLSNQLLERIEKEYTSFYRASKATGVARKYFTLCRQHPTYSNIIKLANECGYDVEVLIK